MAPDEVEHFADSQFAEQLMECAEHCGPRLPRPRNSGRHRSASPFAPWNDEERIREKKRRNSNQKGSKKVGSKEGTKKKERKDNGRNGGSLRKTRTSPTESGSNSSRGSFQHHSDTSRYIREYREVRMRISSCHQECSCHGCFNEEDVMRIYSSLGINSSSRFSRRYKRLNASPEEDSADSKSSPLGGGVADEGENDAEDPDLEDERELSSPDARLRRNNLNLSPLRKHVRLPDMSNYPVQTVSGLGVKELVRLATARGESRQQERGNGLRTPKITYSSSGDKRRLSDLPIHLQEKTLCRVVELTIPEHLGSDTSHLEVGDKGAEKEEEKSKAHREREKENRASGELQERRVSRLSKLSERDDDALTLAIGTSRSCQSSVLSHAVSPLSESGHLAKRSNTVREMLAASVRELQPFEGNSPHGKYPGHPPGGADGTKPLLAEPRPKQVLPLKSYRNLAYKPSMRKFLQEIYTTESSVTTSNQHQGCHISGTPLRRLSTDDVTIPDVTRRRVPSPGPGIEPPTIDLPPVHDNLCAARLLKRARQRQLAAETYESFRRVVTLEGQHRPKLAIFSKCHTVVKSQVSVRGVAL